jgi:cyclophilin family peptidyl-prolyl cis-trans isomerase/HEAT repeat protein
MRRRAPFLAVLLLAGCVDFGPPPGPPAGTYSERLRIHARLLRMEDRRSYDPLLTGRAASSPDPWIRAKTALAAGRLREPEASAYFPVLLKDGDAAVRRAAAFGAGLSGDVRTVRFLVGALDDGDPETAARAAEALGKLGGPEALAALLAAASGPSSARAAAATALFRNPGPESVERLRAISSDGALPPPVARAALYALARKPRPEAGPVLRAALSWNDPESAAYAARALGILADEASAGTLAELARRTEPSVAIQSLVALEKLGTKGPLPSGARSAALLRCEDPAPGIAVAALRLLGRLGGDGEVLAALERIARGGGWRGQTALTSLARVDSVRARPALFAAASGTPLEGKLAVAETFGFLPEKDVLALLPRLLGDRAARVRSAALSALPKELVAKLPSAAAPGLTDPDPLVRASALEVLAPAVDGAGGTLLADWQAALGKALGEKEPDFIVGALDAAAARKTGARELLEGRVDDPDPVVREKARRLLVDGFAAKPESFRKIPIQTRFSASDYDRLARAANESVFTAQVVTTRGAFTIELVPEEAPMTVENFRALAAKGFFDRGTFHRVVPDFVIQDGDPRGDGSGGPGYAIRDEINPLRYRRGAVGMALSGPDTGGSQWFVTLSLQMHLDGGYTVFGSVASGMEAADAIEQDDGIRTIRVTEGRRLVPPGGATGP